MKTKEEVDKMERSLKFLKRIQKVLAVDEARKTDVVQSVRSFGNRYQDRFKVVHAAMILNPFRVDINALDDYVMNGPDTEKPLYTTRTMVIGSFASELDEYKHVNPSRTSVNRKGSVAYRDARERHSILKL